MRNVRQIELDLATFARSENGGLIVTTGAPVSVHRDLIIALAAKHKLPTVYPYRYLAAGGGLMSYAPDQADGYRRAASYVDRILKGEKPANLPVQAPTKYELVINLKTAKALGLSVPQSLLSRADEVIEAARVHRHYWRCGGGMAARRKRAAGGQAADYRVPGLERFSLASMD